LLVMNMMTNPMRKAMSMTIVLCMMNSFLFMIFPSESS
jgi:TRAP-type C4-dicarboxylate transport system permease small subunit